MDTVVPKYAMLHEHLIQHQFLNLLVIFYPDEYFISTSIDITY